MDVGNLVPGIAGVDDERGDAERLAWLAGGTREHDRVRESPHMPA